MRNLLFIAILFITFSCSNDTQKTNVKDISVTTSSEEARKLFFDYLFLTEQGENIEAQDNLKKALRLDPNFQIAKIYSNLNQPKNTIEAFNNRESVSELEKLIIEANYYSRRQEYDRAYDAATQLTDNYPDISRAWSISAEIKSITGDLYESIEESEEAIALDPNNFSAYLNLLTKHIIVGNGEGILPPGERDLEKAEEIISVMRSIRPDAPFSYMLSGNFARRTNKLEEAFDFYKQSKEVNKSGNSQLLQSNHYMALTNTFLEKYDEAEQLFRENISLSEEGSFWLSYQSLFIAKMNTFRNNFDRAIEVLDELERDLPNYGYSQQQILGNQVSIGISKFLNFSHSQQDREAVESIEYIKSKLVELTDLNKANYSKDEYDRQIRNINRDILILFTWNDILFGRYDGARTKLVDIKKYAEEDVKSNPRAFHDYYAFSGMINLNEGNFTEAIKDFESTDNTVTAGLYINRVCGTYFEYFYALALKGSGNSEKANSILSRLATTNFYGYDNALVRSLAASQL